MNKEKLEKELKEIEEEIEKTNKRISNSPKYKSLANIQNNLWKKGEEKRIELRGLRKKIYSKYVKNYRSFGVLRATNIKSSVKEGIKRGLELKYINLINEDDIKKIVRRLINEDLEKTNENEILSDISKIDKKIKEIGNDKIRLGNEANTLIKKRERIENKLNKEELDKKKLKKEKRKEVAKIVEEKLPDFMGKIKNEVEKGLILEALKD